MKNILESLGDDNQEYWFFSIFLEEMSIVLIEKGGSFLAIRKRRADPKKMLQEELPYNFLKMLLYTICFRTQKLFIRSP